jgi:hypothetical protein
MVEKLYRLQEDDDPIGDEDSDDFPPADDDSFDDSF